MISFKNVTKSFGSIYAIDDITFDVADGEFLFLTGPSGAGKTTLLKMILADIKPTTGSIEFDGMDISLIKDKQIPLIRQKIGTVFQDFKLLPDKTVGENVEVALAVVGIPASEWEARINRVLELVGLADRKNLFPLQLSGGEVQRAALARALVINPTVILADEPTGNLDWDTAESIVNLLVEINKEGKTIIFATHHQGILDRIKKRTIRLEKGKIVKDK